MRAVLSLLALLMAASPSCRESPGHRERVLVVAKARDVTTLDPARATDLDSMDVLVEIYETLVRPARNSFDIRPGLAVSWSASTDLKEWTFHLRRNVSFHDGTKLDADAVVYSFLRQSRGGVRQKEFVYWNSAFADIVANVERVDDYTVRFVLTKPFAPFLASLAMIPVSIVSPTAAKRYGDDLSTHPVGTGPYRFVGWDQATGTVTLRAFSKYWGPKPKIERLAFRRIRDARHRLLALESGSAQIIRDLDPVTMRIVRLHPELSLLSTVGNAVCFLVLNTSKPPFNNPAARWAVNRAIRKQAFTKLIYQGLAEPASGPLPPSIAWAYWGKTKKYPYDPVKAREELAAAGYRDLPGSHPKLLVMDSPRPYLPKPLLAASMIARDLARVGMTVDVVAQPYPDHKESMRRGEHDLALYGWVGDTGDPDNFLYTLLSPRSALNLAFWRHADYSKLVDAAREARDRAERARYYRKAQELATREAPWVPLAYPRLIAAISSQVTGVELHPSGLLRLEGADMR